MAQSVAAWAAVGLCLCCVVLCAIAIGFPLWSKASYAADVQHKVGLWQACVVSGSTETCVETSSVSQCTGWLDAARSLALLALLCFIATGVAAVLCHKAATSRGPRLTAFGLGLLSTGCSFAAWACWMVYAQGTDCYAPLAGNRLASYDTSTLLMVVASCVSIWLNVATLQMVLSAPRRPRPTKLDLDYPAEVNFIPFENPRGSEPVKAARPAIPPARLHLAMLAPPPPIMGRPMAIMARAPHPAARVPVYFAPTVMAPRNPAFPGTGEPPRLAAAP